ncbi:MAG: phenylalanine 4-monooxygenase [Acidimicrobiales bacterium]
MDRSRYSPVRTGPNGRARVELADDHPGVTDPSYRERRDALAELALAWTPGQAIARPTYRDEEHRVWQLVSAQLEGLHERFACQAFLEGKEALALPTERIPQLDEVTTLLEPSAGFRYQPVAGLAPLRDFYRSFADGVFWSTQYIRHPSEPLYTPEPDLIHEVIGHANQLAHPVFPELYRLFGDAVNRVGSDDALRFLSQVFWYTMEFGVLWEGSDLRAFGAGILSSVGETRTFGQADIRPADISAMGWASYDIAHPQPVLYSWSSISEMHHRLGEFVSDFDDAGFESLEARHLVA